MTGRVPIMKNERETLTKVAALLRSQNPVFDFNGARVRLNMRMFVGEPGCTTTACIAGFCAMVENPGLSLQDVDTIGAGYARAERASPAIRALFFAKGADGHAYMSEYEIRADPLLAAEAIDNYLAGMEHPWQPILERLKIV